MLNPTQLPPPPTTTYTAVLPVALHRGGAPTTNTGRLIGQDDAQAAPTRGTRGGMGLSYLPFPIIVYRTNLLTNIRLSRCTGGGEGGEWEEGEGADRPAAAPGDGAATTTSHGGGGAGRHAVSRLVVVALSLVLACTCACALLGVDRGNPPSTRLLNTHTNGHRPPLSPPPPSAPLPLPRISLGQMEARALELLRSDATALQAVAAAGKGAFLCVCVCVYHREGSGGLAWGYIACVHTVVSLLSA